MRTTLLSLIALCMGACSTTPTPEQQAKEAKLESAARLGDKQLEQSGQVPAGDRPSSIHTSEKEGLYIDL